MTCKTPHQPHLHLLLQAKPQFMPRTQNLTCPLRSLMMANLAVTAPSFLSAHWALNSKPHCSSLSKVAFIITLLSGRAMGVGYSSMGCALTLLCWLGVVHQWDAPSVWLLPHQTDFIYNYFFTLFITKYMYMIWHVWATLDKDTAQQALANTSLSLKWPTYDMANIGKM